MKVLFYWARFAWFLFLVINIWFFGARALAATHEVTFDRLFPQNSYERLLSLTVRVYHLVQTAQMQPWQLQDIVQVLVHTINTMPAHELAYISKEDMDYLNLLIDSLSAL